MHSGGDFNCTLNPALDHNSAEPHPESAKTLAEAAQRFSLDDAWRVQHPHECGFSWCRCERNIVTLVRLDIFYVYWKLNIDVLNNTDFQEALRVGVAGPRLQKREFC